MIIVSPSFYHENSQTDFGSSVRELRAFHLDFEEHLMPAVEGRYHTYARSAAPEDLAASRDHRAFAGFSLGSVTTWLEFCYDYDYIRYFLPMSGSCWYYGTYGDFRFAENVDFIEELVRRENLSERGYFIYAATGTRDAVRNQTDTQLSLMLERELFTPDHVVYYQKEGGVHDFEAVQEYLYNALPLFFREGQGVTGKTNHPPPVTETTTVAEVENLPAFGDFGRLRGSRHGADGVEIDSHITWAGRRCEAPRRRFPFRPASEDTARFPSQCREDGGCQSPCT